MESASGSQVYFMQMNKINVKIYTKATMHHKFCLIDSPSFDENLKLFLANCNDTNANDAESRRTVVLPKNGLLITGSLNYTREALSSNVENVIVTSDLKLIKKYQRFFTDCWNKC